MTPEFSPNTQVILLLTAPLIAGRNDPSSDLLTPSEYKRLARHLHQSSREPADLLSSRADEVLQEAKAIVDVTRLKRLLARGFALSQAIERWQTRAIWVVSRADPDYPKRLKGRLRDDRPAVLYGCGERSILDGGGLAVVGSRNVDDDLIEYTQSIGRLTAKARRTLVSGGARGIDQAAMRGAIDAGGKVAGVLADGLEKSAMNRDHRSLLMDGQLVLISPYDPSAGFNVGNAMQRNKLIYALADAALVVNSDLEKGGTWSGAVEQLGKLRFVPVFVRSTGKTNMALAALIQKGALPWPNPDDVDSMAEVLDNARSPVPQATPQPQLPLVAPEPVSSEETATAVNLPEPTAVEAMEVEATVKCVEALSTASLPISPADELLESAKRSILRVLETPRKLPDLASELRVTQAQLKEWLLFLIEEGRVEKAKGSQYRLHTTHLFDLVTESNHHNTSKASK